MNALSEDQHQQDHAEGRENGLASSNATLSKEYLSSRSQTKNLLVGIDQIQTTSPAQKPATDDSTFFPQQKRRCMNCLDIQKLLIQIQTQLKHQKRKNSKYAKIIHAKVAKEKQLQQAYCQIAKQMKKRIDVGGKNQGCEHISDILVRQNQQIAEKLKKTQLELAQKIQAIQILNDRIYSQNGSSSLLRVERRKQNMVLDHKVSDITISKQAKRQKLNIYHYPVEVNILAVQEQQLGQMKMEGILCEQQTSEQKGLNRRKQEKDSLIVQNYIFDKQNNSSNLSQYELKSQRKNSLLQQFKTVNEIQSSANYYSIQSQSQKFIQQLSIIDKIPNNGLYNQPQGRKSSFYSIPEADLEILDISNVLIKDSYAGDQNNRKSDKQMLQNFVYEELQGRSENNRPMLKKRSKNQAKLQCAQAQTQTQIIENSEPEREEALKYAYIFSEFNSKITSFRQRYISSSKIHKDSVPIDLQDLHNFQKSKIQKALKLAFQQIQNILRSQKKQYQRKINDQQLYISDFQNKLQQVEIQRTELQKIVENYQFHKALMDFNQLEQLGRQPSQLYSQTKRMSISSELIESAQRRINSIKFSKTKNQQTECIILSSDLLNKYNCLDQRNVQLIQELNQIPLILTDLSYKIGGSRKYVIDLQQNITKQIQNMLKTFSQQILRQNKSFTKDEFLQAPSSIIDRTPSFRKNSQKNPALQLLQTENLQLKSTLKQKAEEILKLREKIALQNIEKVNHDRDVQNLKREINALSTQLKEKQMTFSTSKMQKQQSVVARQTPGKERASQSEEFLQYEQKKQYNNLYWDREEELKVLRQKLQDYETELNKYRLQHKKKKKIVYINN